MPSTCRAPSTRWCRTPTRCTLVGAFVPLVFGAVLEARHHAGRAAVHHRRHRHLVGASSQVAPRRWFPANLAGLLASAWSAWCSARWRRSVLVNRHDPDHTSRASLHCGPIGRCRVPHAGPAAGWQRPASGPPGSGVPGPIISVLRQGFSHADLRLPLLCLRPREGRAAEAVRPVLTHLPGLRRRGLRQAGHRGRLPAQGLGLVRHRFPGGNSGHRHGGRPTRRRPNGATDQGPRRRVRPSPAAARQPSSGSCRLHAPCAAGRSPLRRPPLMPALK
jgi:hypothetical protein